MNFGHFLRDRKSQNKFIACITNISIINLTFESYQINFDVAVIMPISYYAKKDLHHSNRVIKGITDFIVKSTFIQIKKEVVKSSYF